MNYGKVWLSESDKWRGYSRELVLKAETMTREIFEGPQNIF
jgi:hypothetical protein